ncbi:MAG: DNA primase, partial [Desulfurococcales archaeon]|nr:DNA primase [Desulfurococcales archaeon]
PKPEEKPVPPQPPKPAVEQPPTTTELKPVAEIPKKIIDTIKELRGTLEAVFYDKDWNEIKRVKVRELYENIQKAEPGTIHAVVFDGIITQRIMDAAASKGIKILIGSRVGSKVQSKPEGVIYLTFSDLI